LEVIGSTSVRVTIVQVVQGEIPEASIHPEIPQADLSARSSAEDAAALDDESESHGCLVDSLHGTE
jgi:hypothetical protein